MTFRTFFAGTCLLAFPMIAAAQTRVDIDEGRDFTRYQTFTVEVQAPVRVDGEIDELNTIVLNRQREAITQQLRWRGLNQTDTAPDLVVRVRSREIERTELRSSSAPYYYAGWGSPWGFGYWGGWGGPAYWGADVWTYRYLEGEMLVDVFDGRSGDLVYRAQVSRTVDDDDMQEDAAKFARKAFKKFPIGGDLDD